MNEGCKHPPLATHHAERCQSVRTESDPTFISFISDSNHTFNLVKRYSYEEQLRLFCGRGFGSEWVSMDGVTWLFCHAHVHAVEERCYLVLCDLFGPRERSIFVPALRVFIEREILVIRRSVLCIGIRRDGNNNTYCMCFIITLLRTPSLPLVARSELQLI